MSEKIIEMNSNYMKSCKFLRDTEEEISNAMSEFKTKIEDKEMTVKVEGKIKKLLDNYLGKIRELENEYQQKNCPHNFPQVEFDKRQKKIQEYRINYDDMNKKFNSCVNKKYSFKNKITDDYSKKEEFKDMSRDELLALEKEKRQKQDDKLGEIVIEVKKNTVLAKEAKEIIKENNDKMDVIQEDMDKVGEKITSITDRFKNYAVNSSWCKIIFLLVLEIIVALAGYIFLF